MLFDRFRQVRAFVFAIDGVCTDGRVWIAGEGERGFALHSRDRYALQLAAAHYPIALIGNGHLPGIKRWMAGLDMADFLVDVRDNISMVADWMADKGVSEADVLGMGGDLVHLPAIVASTDFFTCPADAAEGVKAAAAYISPCNGGGGAVRDVIEKVMKLQGTWERAGEFKARVV